MDAKTHRRSARYVVDNWPLLIAYVLIVVVAIVALWRQRDIENQRRADERVTFLVHCTDDNAVRASLLSALTVIAATDTPIGRDPAFASFITQAKVDLAPIDCLTFREKVLHPTVGAGR